jgi:hypothetical protein
VQGEKGAGEKGAAETGAAETGASHFGEDLQRPQSGASAYNGLGFPKLRSAAMAVGEGPETNVFGPLVVAKNDLADLEKCSMVFENRTRVFENRTRAFFHEL